MKLYSCNFIKIILFFFTPILFFSSFSETKLSNRNVEIDLLRTGFVNPPDSIQTSVYWYWISDNISKEGVIKDLHAMKDAGINRAFIGNIGLKELPFGKVKMLSDEWWEILHTALKTATELGIEIGIFNSPGWSQSGGPWVKPEESMRYLTSSETYVSGPKRVVQQLEQPTDRFQDVKVLAFKQIKKNEIVTKDNAYISSDPIVPNINAIFDGNPATSILLPKEHSLSIDLILNDPIIIRSVTIQTTNYPIDAKGILQAKTDRNEYKTISEFKINRSNPHLHVGFKPYAPIVVAVPITKSREYRLIIKDANEGSGITDVLLQSAPRVERYAEKTLAKMWQTPLPLWDAYLWPKQPIVDDLSTVIQVDNVIDISQYMAMNGTLTWEVPEGEWIITRMGMTPTNVTNNPASPEATGLEIDKMSKRHIKRHFEAFIGEILTRIPQLDRQCFKVVVQDSYETGGQNFTDGFIDEFKNRYHYDPIPYLPTYLGYIVHDEVESDRFLWDMRRLVADKIAYDYVGGLREISHQHGLTTWLENYGHWGFPSEFLMYGGQSDEISGEYWSEGELGDIENRAATSCGHIYGKNKISAESNTAGGRAYSRFPAMMKQRNDRFFAEGINNTLLHVFISQPYEDKNPGVNAGFGNEFDRKNTWFSQLDAYIQYLKRVNFMLQQGLNVADVAYFIGEDTPKMTGVTDPSLPVGYQFDYMNAEVILRDMTVKKGLLTLPHGTQYRMMVLPKLETMRPELLLKIRQLIIDGATIMGPAPFRSPSLQNQPKADEQIQILSQEIWGEVDGISTKYRKFGEGMIINGMNIKEALALIHCVPDCELPDDNIIHYGHRSLKNGTDIYFVSNQTNQTQIITPRFRVKNKLPELWEPVTGHSRRLPSFECKDNITSVPMKLAPYESSFLFFGEETTNGHQFIDLEANYPTPRHTININNGWVVQFDSIRGGPNEAVAFDTLKDWTSFTDERIKYYSGTATYSNTFVMNVLPEEHELIVNLGELTSMGKVYINEQYAGAAWTAPYQLNISSLVKKGANKIRIEVVNNWMNRLIGDLNRTDKKSSTWCFVNPYTKESKLQPSGLLGPVTINMVKY